MEVSYFGHLLIGDTGGVSRLLEEDPSDVSSELVGIVCALPATSSPNTCRLLCDEEY